MGAGGCEAPGAAHGGALSTYSASASSSSDAGPFSPAGAGGGNSPWSTSSRFNGGGRDAGREGPWSRPVHPAALPAGAGTGGRCGEFILVQTAPVPEDVSARRASVVRAGAQRNCGKSVAARFASTCECGGSTTGRWERRRGGEMCIEVGAGLAPRWAAGRARRRTRPTTQDLPAAPAPEARRLLVLGFVAEPNRS